MKTHSVIIVDDHVLLAQAVAGLVKGFSDFDVLHLCRNGKELLSYLENGGKIPDLVLMDVNMPIMNGIEATEHLSSDYPDILVLALSVEEDENSIIRMLRAGAKGYLLKDVDKNTLEMALKETMEKGYHYTKRVSDLLIGTLKNDNNESTLQLNDRETEFLRLVCTEMTYKEIADKMFLSPKTIDGYRDTLFQKLNVRNRIGLVLYAIRTRIFVP